MTADPERMDARRRSYLLGEDLSAQWETLVTQSECSHPGHLRTGQALRLMEDAWRAGRADALAGITNADLDVLGRISTHLDVLARHGSAPAVGDLERDALRGILRKLGMEHRPLERPSLPAGGSEPTGEEQPT